jgi:hypothetical protein
MTVLDQPSSLSVVCMYPNQYKRYIILDWDWQVTKNVFEKQDNFVTRMEMTSATCGTLFYTIAQPGRQDQFVIVKTKMSLSISSIPRWNFARVAVTNKKNTFPTDRCKRRREFFGTNTQGRFGTTGLKVGSLLNDFGGFSPNHICGRLDVGFLHGKKEK